MVTTAERLAAWRDYLRAALWRLRGARVGPRCRVGVRCEATRLSGLTMGSRVVLESGVCVKLVEEGATAHLADNVFLGRGVILDVSQRLTIGTGTLIAPGCFITDHNHGVALDAPIWKQRCPAKPVQIGAGAWLGAGVVVLPGVSIGDGAVVGAGAVVTRDVPAMTIVGGIPARQIRSRSRRDGSV